MIAQQLTLIEAELFAAVPAGQLLGNRRTSAERAPHVHALVLRFNLVSMWAATEIMSAAAIDRISVLEKLIDITTVSKLS